MGLANSLIPLLSVARLQYDLQLVQYFAVSALWHLEQHGNRI